MSDGLGSESSGRYYMPYLSHWNIIYKPLTASANAVSLCVYII